MESVDIPQRVPVRLAAARRVLAITGAGISAESGVPTFRGKDGLWKQFRAEELATPEAFARDPKTVWEWYDYRRGILSRVEPNPAHQALARIGAEKECLVATQNVDRLHQKAGSRNVVEIHGCIWEVRCTAEGTTVLDERVPLPGIPPKCSCGALLRPGVVWFGESLPMDRFERIDSWARSGEVDLTFVIGTSALFPYIQAWARSAQAGGSLLVEINPEPTPVSEFADEVLLGRAGEILPAVVNRVLGF
jgi:NAD-dependent deacetylase